MYFFSHGDGDTLLDFDSLLDNLLPHSTYATANKIVYFDVIVNFALKHFPIRLRSQRKKSGWITNKKKTKSAECYNIEENIFRFVERNKKITV